MDVREIIDARFFDTLDFSDTRDMNTIRLFGHAYVGDRSRTNMQVASQFSYDSSFVIKGVVVSLNSVDIEQIKSAVLTIEVGCKVMLELHLSTYARRDNNELFYNLDRPILVSPRQFFSLRLEPTIYEFPLRGVMQVSICGSLTRDVM